MPRDVSQALLVVQLYQDPVGTLRVAGPHSLKRGEPAWKEATATPHDVAAWIKHARAQGWAPDSPALMTLSAPSAADWARPEAIGASPSRAELVRAGLKPCP